MSGCAGLSPPPEMALQKTVIDHLLAEGVAVLVVDPFAPRNEPEGVCANLNGDTFVKNGTRGGDDVVAALKVLKATPGVDPDRVFLQGYSWGAISSLFALDTNRPNVKNPDFRVGHYWGGFFLPSADASIRGAWRRSRSRQC
jgi:dienelactone hydrolase